LEPLEFSQIQKQQTKFLTELKNSSKSANSLKCYRLDFQCFNDFFNENFKNQKMVFNEHVVENFEFYLEKKYQSINSRRRKLQTLRLFFDFLVKNSFYPENPIKKIASAAKSLLPPRPTLFFEIQKTFALFREVKTESDLEEVIHLRNICIFLLTYEAALNVSVLTDLKKSSLLFGEKEFRIMITPEKRDPYSISLPLVHQNFFKEYLEILEGYNTKLKLKFEHLFFYANSKRIIKGGISPRGIEELFQKKSVELDSHITPKSFRQAGILKWLLEGANETSIKEWMGVAPSYSLVLYKKYIEDQKNDEQNSDPLMYQEIAL
jgi:site-specific recombinase XerD